MPTAAESGKRNGSPKGAVEPVDKPSAGYDVDANGSRAARQPKKRVAVLVDGFNLYHGVHEQSGRKHLWLDLWALSESLLKDDQTLVAIHYFTARVRDDVEGAARQNVYLNALKSVGVRVVEGRFQEKELTCRKCGKSWRSYEEKESDVNLCLTLLESATAKSFDVALIVSGDSDMVPAVKAVRRHDRNLRLVAVFPPKRFSDELKRAVDASMHLGAAKIRQAQFPDEVVDGERIHVRPPYWS